MTKPKPKTSAVQPFPPPPIKGGRVLVPIRSWPEMYREMAVTGVEFDAHWYECVEDEVAYFFRWMGEPRSTVLVVWDDRGLTHVACRTLGDRLLTPKESKPIVNGITRAFRRAQIGTPRSER
jgi:hypothetical protein